VLIGNPFDTTISAWQMAISGLFDRYDMGDLTPIESLKAAKLTSREMEKIVKNTMALYKIV
jgi:hypothetical protein